MIERSILALLLVGLLIGVIPIVKPFTTAILFGAALATAAWPMRQALVRRGLGRGSTAALLLLLSLVLVVLPLLAFAPHLADQLGDVASRNETLTRECRIDCERAHEGAPRKFTRGEGADDTLLRRIE